MVLFASAEWLVILFRLAIQDMKQEKDDSSSRKVSHVLVSGLLLIFPPILSYCFLFTFVKQTGHWWELRVQKTCSLASQKVVSQCRSRVTQQQWSWAGVCESRCYELDTNFAWGDMLWQALIIYLCGEMACFQGSDTRISAKHCKCSQQPAKISMHILRTTVCMIFLSNTWYFMQCVCKKIFVMHLLHIKASSQIWQNLKIFAGSDVFWSSTLVMGEMGREEN